MPGTVNQAAADEEPLPPFLVDVLEPDEPEADGEDEDEDVDAPEDDEPPLSLFDVPPPELPLESDEAGADEDADDLLSVR